MYPLYGVRTDYSEGRSSDDSEATDISCDVAVRC